jgi:hypothetical protein
VGRAWARLLVAQPPEELTAQRFLEEHPCLLPYGLPFSEASNEVFGHHGTVLGAVFSQPRLPGPIDLRPDFMRITRDSRWTYVTLFELKAISRPIFREGDGRFLDLFDAARAQLQGYGAWIGDARNWAEFTSRYRLPSYVDHRDISLRLVLLAGRRAEVYRHPASRDRRRREQLLAVSLDSLSPDADARDDVTVRAGKRGLRAMHVQPTLRLGPANSDGLLVMSGLDAAVKRSALLTDARKQFLLDRLPYWRAWERAPGLKVRPASYRE